MKTKKTLLIVLIFTSVVSYSSGRSEADYTKTVWSKISKSDKANQKLFFPYDSELVGFDSASNSFKEDLLFRDSDKIKLNLYNVLFYSFLKGNLGIYSPFDPNSYSTKDEGELKFHFSSKDWGEKDSGTFFTDMKFQEAVKMYEYVGYEVFIEHPMPYASTLYPGEDSINNGYVVYPPNPYVWYTDKDIVEYHLKETWTLSPNGKTLKKEIDAIAPVVNLFDEKTKEVTGVKTLFWIDFDKLMTLESFLDTKKIKGVMKKRKFSSTIIKEKIKE